jgi:hypothetical protein
MFRTKWPWIFVVLLIASSVMAQWHALPAGQPEVVAFAASSTGQRMILSAQQAGVWLTNDGGATWEPINSRMSDTGYVDVRHFDMTDAAGSFILSDAQMWIEGTTAQSFSSDGGETWHGHAPVSNLQICGLQAWRTDPNIWLCAGNGLYQSVSQGVTWDEISHVTTVYWG